MTLLDPPPIRPEKSRALAITITALVMVGLVVLFFVFRYYPEQKAVSNFFMAVVAGDMNKAYELWKPSSSYTQKDFLADWGPEGYYGPVKSFKVIDAKAPKNSNAIRVNVAVSPFSPMPDANDAEKSRKTKVVTLWVQPSDKSLSFPP